MLAYLSANLWALWLLVAIVCMLIELTSFDFYITCVALGALGAMLGALIGLPLWMEVIVWALVALLSVCFIRPVLTNHLHKREHKRSSNAEALIGKRGVVIETIARGGYGYVKIDGDEWRSVADDGAEIAAGKTVEVVDRESIILTVKTINDLSAR